MANILLDLDNTLTKVEPVLDKMASVFNKPFVNSDDIESYNLSDIFGTTEEQDRFFWEHFGYEVIEKSEPNSATIDSIYRNVIEKTDKIYVVTARPESQRKITEDWIEKFKIPCHDIILTGKHSKTGVIESLEIDTIIDDQPKLYAELDVIKDLFPDSHISNIMTNNQIKRYIVDYGYNRDVKSEFRIDRKTGEITNGI